MNALAQAPLTGREKVLALEAAMKAMPEHQVEIKTTHDFAPGLYARSVFIPAGVTVVGKIHRTKHMNMLVQGELSVMTENGVERLHAPCVIVSEPGIKRVGYAHTDCVWTTFHVTEETDLEKLEQELIAPHFEALEGYPLSLIGEP